jgi:hypothetical protein
MANPECMHSTTDCVSAAAVNFTESYQTVNNISAINIVQTVVDGNRTFAYLGDSTVPSGLDFVAYTVAVSTQCAPITSICNLRAFSNVSPGSAGPAMEFNCSSGFFSNQDVQLYPMGPPSIIWQMGYFQDNNLTVPVEVSDSNASTIMPNPVYSGIAAVMDIHGTSTDYPLYNDSEIVHYDSYGQILGDGFVLRCETEVYDAEYTWINGSFGNFTNLTLSNETVSLIVSGRFLYLPNYLPIPGVLQLINGAGLACLQNTTNDLADTAATVYSQASLGGAAGVFVPVENSKEWTQQTVLLTRIPFAPLHPCNLELCLCSDRYIAWRRGGGEHSWTSCGRRCSSKIVSVGAG